MYNEEVHCERVVESCCQLKWPAGRMMVQVGHFILESRVYALPAPVA